MDGIFQIIMIQYVWRLYFGYMCSAAWKPPGGALNAKLNPSHPFFPLFKHKNVTPVI